MIFKKQLNFCSLIASFMLFAPFIFSNSADGIERKKPACVAAVTPSNEEVLPLLKLCYTSKQCDTAYKGLIELAQKYPLSSDLQTRLGGIALHEISNPSMARTHYQKALELHESGCRLNSESSEWIVIDGTGLSYMFQEDFKNSQIWFKKSVKRWPESSSSQYNLACSYCRNGNVKACFSAFEKSLQAISMKNTPEFLLKNARPASYWIEKSKTDSDLELLRKSPDYQSLLKKYTNAESLPYIKSGH